MATGLYPTYLAAKRESGEYTDFTLVCEGHELRVHKLVVCGQSPMMAAAVRSNFNEAKTDTLEVNFDLATCQQMIDFLYTGDYQHSTPEPTSDANQLIDELRQHVEVNKIADYYGVDPLCELASSKMSCIFLEDWSADIFTTILEMGFHAIGNIAFHKMAAGVTSAHIQELSAHAAFSKLDFPAKFTAQLVLATSNITASWQRCQSAAKHQCPKTTARAKYTINSEPYGWNIGFTCTYCGETF